MSFDHAEGGAEQGGVTQLGPWIHRWNGPSQEDRRDKGQGGSYGVRRPPPERFGEKATDRARSKNSDHQPRGDGSDHVSALARLGKVTGKGRQQGPGHCCEANQDQCEEQHLKGRSYGSYSKGGGAKEHHQRQETSSIHDIT
ncbi:hypothetical protein GCM10009825_38420 [Arthrobacter humicola]|uniref:Uncharacterized protein n=1 Tax=Arthrobacter humicola TaxID=409291 RepID=A0ABN2ZPQ0_9MICC